VMFISLLAAGIVVGLFGKRGLLLLHVYFVVVVVVMIYMHLRF